MSASSAADRLHYALQVALAEADACGNGVVGAMLSHCLDLVINEDDGSVPGDRAQAREEAHSSFR